MIASFSLRSWGSLAAFAAGLVLLPVVSPAALSGQDDVELLGEMYGARPPAGYYELKAANPGAFEFSRAWHARNPRIGVTGEEFEVEPRFDVRAGAAGERVFDAVSTPAAVLGRRNGAVEGTFRFPLILGTFADQVGPVPYAPADVQREFFDGPNSEYKTVREYYDEVSGGRVTLLGETHGWAQAGLTRLQTTSGVSALGGRVGLFIQQLLAAVDDGSIDWGRYDNDGPDGLPNSGDDDGFVDVLAVLHPGFGAECGGAGLEDRVWSHKWSLSDAWWSIPEDERPPEGMYTTGSPAASGGTIRIDDYTIQPLLSCDATSINEIGVLAHELGHGFGLPDLYCTTSGCVSNGIGRWGLMGSGGWGCGAHDPARPCHMSAWSKSVLGWVDVETLPPDTDHGTISLDPVQTSGRVLRIDARDGSDEYFLVENRQPLGFDSGLLSPGLLVWHIDPDFITERWPFNSVNGRGDHLGVWLRQADGRLGLEGGANRADGGDPFPGASQTTEFHAGAAPASVTHEGSAAGVTLTDIADAGGGVMTLRSMSGYRMVTVEVDGSETPGLVRVDDEPIPAGGGSYLRAPFQGLVLAAEEGESLEPGVRRPFLRWADDPAASRLRVLVTPRDSDPVVTAVFGTEEVRITAEVVGGILDVVPGAVVTTPPSTDLWVPRAEPVSLRADAAEGFAFVDWLGGYAGRSNPFELTPLTPVTVGAEFGLTFLSLARALVGDGGTLPVELAGALDADGNDNGRYDVGDLRAFLRSGAALATAPVVGVDAGGAR